MQLSKYYTLADLTKGQGGMLSAATMQNLQKLATLNDYIREDVGPFDITSAYRSPTKQESLITSGNTQAIEGSYHSTGEAEDITPTSLQVADFVERIKNSPRIIAMIGQLAVKKHTVHLSLRTQRFPDFTPMFVADNGLYYRFTPTDFSNYLASGLRPIASDLAPEPGFSAEPPGALLAGTAKLPTLIILSSLLAGFLLWRRYGDK